MESTIHSLTVAWEAPTLNLSIHSPVIEYCVDCVPVCHELSNTAGGDHLAEGEEESRPGSSKPGSRPASRPGTDYHSPPPVVIKMVPISHVHPEHTKELRLKVHNLYPATPYHFYVKVRSLSGWTEYSRPFLYHTLASRPEPPSPIEVIKITTNGLLLTWHAPVRDNGHALDFYQIELIDAGEFYAQQAAQATADALGSSTVDGSKVTTTSSSSFSETAAKVPRMRKASMLSGGAGQQSEAAREKEGEIQQRKKELGDSGGFSKWHRLIKHRNTDSRFK